VAVAAVVGVWLTRPRARITPSDIRSVRSIAVLPFTDARADSAAAYLGSGIADALATALSKLPELRVVVNHSSVRAGRTVDARDVGKALNVESVLEASVTRLGDRLRIRAHLVRVADGTILWGETYDRTASNMFELEDEVTGTIARELRGSLAGERGLAEAALLRGTNDLKAYDLYQRGRQAWRKRGDSLLTAIELFNGALALDPRFARAHAGLAMTWVIMPMFHSSVGTDSALIIAKQSANRALALDSSLADAHLAIAYAYKNMWRWDEAEPHFQTALRLAPLDATVHHWYGVQLYAIGKLRQSIDELRRARENGPFETTVALDGAIALYSARRYDDARSEVIRGLALDGTRPDLVWFQGAIQLAQGRADSALRSFETARGMGIGFTDIRAYLSVAHRTLGRVREADAEYGALRRDYAAGRTSPWGLAVAAAGAGDSATALAAVERMMERRDLLASELSLPCDPLFDPLRSNPRFERLLASAGMRCEGLSFRTK
jgi:TolB-like protein/Flp pilus assembly protein TadD